MQDYKWTGVDLESKVFFIWYSVTTGWMYSANSQPIEFIQIHNDRNFIFYKLTGNKELKRPYDIFEEKGAAQLECQLRNGNNVKPEDLIPATLVEALKVMDPEDE